MNKKLLIVSCVFPPEPVVSAKISFSLAIAASEQLKVEVVSPLPSRPHGFVFDEIFRTGNINKEYVNDSLTIYRLPTYTSPRSSALGRLIESISFGHATYKYILNNYSKIERVYMNTWPLFGQLGVAFACNKKNIPYVIHVQDVYPESLVNKLSPIIRKFVFSLLIPVDKYVLKHANKIITISENMKSLLLATRNIIPEKTLVISNWQDEHEFMPVRIKNKQDNSFTFMYLGNIGAVADVELVIKAFVSSSIDAKLIIAGSGSKKINCIKLAKSYPKALIEFIEVPDGKVAEVQSKADVLLLPLLKGASMSSIPSKLPAYMFSNKPIIALVDESSDTANSIMKAKCGWIGPPGNKESLVDTFKRVYLTDKKILEKMGKSGFEYAKMHFSKEQNLNSLLKEVIN